MGLHIALLGDTILDNKNHIETGEKDLQNQLKAVLEQSEKNVQISLMASDGYATSDVVNGLTLYKKIPDVTHFVLSVGGVDAIIHRQEMWSTGEDSLLKIISLQTQFERRYEKILASLAETKTPVIVIIPYYPQFPEEMKKKGIYSLSVFNDVIFRHATLMGFPIIDLRLTFTEDRDYASATEPSSFGGLKVSKLIAKVIKEFDFTLKRTSIFHDPTPNPEKQVGSPIIQSLNRIKNEIIERKNRFMALESEEKNLDKVATAANNIEKWLEATIETRVWTSKIPTSDEKKALEQLKTEVMQFKAWIFQYSES